MKIPSPSRPDPRFSAALAVGVALAFPIPGAEAAKLPQGSSLSKGWEVREEQAAPADPQQAPPIENAPEGAAPAPVVLPTTGEASEIWHPARVPSVFDTVATPSAYPGSVRVYRLRFRGPKTPRGFGWAFRFEQARRTATVFLNGLRLGKSIDPYTPFQLPAKGLRPGRRNTLTVVVDSRKDERIPEGWWNWGGITRPVRLVPLGRTELGSLGLLSDVSCRGPASGCKANVLLDGMLRRHDASPTPIEPVVTVRLRSPLGRVTKERFELPPQRSPKRPVRLTMRVPAPMLWAPEHPYLYDARVTLRVGGRVQQVERRRIGLRSVQVKGGLLYLNNRRVRLRGASIHEDMPGRGAALTGADFDRIVADLKAVGANVTRAHYLLSEGLLRRLDQAGIMVWNEAPIWQRDRNGGLRSPRARKRLVSSVRRTVIAARSHPSVITHSVANELSFTPDRKPATRRWLITAEKAARELDPTIPISLDIKTRPGFEEQFTLHRFDMLGVNQYFGWYSWVEDFNLLDPYLRELRDLYPNQALVMTEFGAEGRPDLAGATPDVKGGYAFQAAHAVRTLDVVDLHPWLSGALYWTLREFEIFPGWRGGAIPGAGQNTRHHKGLLTYEGAPKPVWYAVRDRFLQTPLYP